MIQLIAGKAGKGKTKNLINMANDIAKTSKGHVVYVDADQSHIYDLNYRIRLVETKEFPLNHYSEFLGFICGIISQDFDIDHIFIDNLLKITHIIEDELAYELVEKLKYISETFNVKFVISMTCDSAALPETLKDYLVA